MEQYCKDRLESWVKLLLDDDSGDSCCQQQTPPTQPHAQPWHDRTIKITIITFLFFLVFVYSMVSDFSIYSTAWLGEGVHSFPRLWWENGDQSILLWTDALWLAYIHTVPLVDFTLLCYPFLDFHSYISVDISCILWWTICNIEFIEI